MSPFIEARIITCLDPKLDVLKSLEKRFTRYNQVQISWTEKNGSDPKLRVQFLSEQAFSENFRENKLVFTTFIQFLAAKSLEIRDLRPNVKSFLEKQSVLDKVDKGHIYPERHTALCHAARVINIDPEACKAD